MLSWDWKDHPRLCGEKLDVENNAEAKAGSPPPMRGKGYTTAAESEENRITPAYAGKSTAAQCTGNHIEDHPRLCGEKPIFVEPDTEISGSPPPMRGKD